MLTADSDVVKTTGASSQPTKFLWGNVIAAAGALLAIGAFFLPWFDLVAQGKTFLSISGQEALSPTAITSARKAAAYRPSRSATGADGRHTRHQPQRSPIQSPPGCAQGSLLNMAANCAATKTPTGPALSRRLGNPSALDRGSDIPGQPQRGSPASGKA